MQGSASFPSRCSLSSALLPLRSPTYREDFRRARLEDLNCFFERISKGLALKNCPEFWLLVERAKEWERSVMVCPKPCSLGKIIAEGKNKLVYVVA
jgi:hypothetical protein